MSEFVMGARLELTDNFSGQMSTATRATEQFIRTADAVNQTVTSFSSAMGGTVQSSQAFADNLQGISTATDAASQDMAAFSATVGRAEQATQSYADGLRSVSTAAENVEPPITQASTSVGGLSGGIRNLTSGVRDFARTRITGVVTGFQEFRTRVTGGETGVRGLWNATRTLARTSLSALHTGITRIGSLAVEAGKHVTKALGGAFKNVAKGAGIVALAGAAAVGTVVAKSVKAFADYEQLTGGVETLFKGSAGIVQEYANNAYKTAGLSANAYMETVTSFSASLLQSVGGDTEKAAHFADTAISDMSDNANKMGTGMDMLQNAYQGFAKQNYTMLDNLKLGYGGTKEEMQRLLTDAEKLSGQKFDLSSYADIVQAIHTVQENMDITGTTAKEAEKTISGSASSMKAAWGNMLVSLTAGGDNFDVCVDNLVASVKTFGSNIMPAITKALSGVGKLVEGLAPLIAQELPGVLNSVIPSLLGATTTIVDSLANALPKLVSTIAPSLVNGMVQIFTSLVNCVPQLLLVGMELIVGLAQGLAKQLPVIVPQAVKAIQTLVTGLMANLDALIIAGLDIINGLIFGIIQNLPLILSAAMQLIQSVVTGLLNNIQLIINCALNLVNALVMGLIQNIPMLLQGALQLIMGIVNGLVSNIQLIIDGALTLVNALVLGIVQNLPTIIQAAVQVVIALAIGLIQAIPQLIAAVPQLVMGIIDTILSTDWLAVGWEIVKGIGSGLWDGIKGIFGGAGEAGGKEMANGAAQGAESGLAAITDASAQTASSFTTGLQPDYSAISGYGVEAGTSLSTGLTTGAAGIGTTATQVGTDAMLGLSSGFTTALPDTLATVSNVGLESVTGLSTGMTDNLGLATTAATSVTTGVTDTFNGIDLHGAGTNAMQGFIDGMNAMRSSIMDVANGIANSVKTTINSALDIHSPSRVLEESGEFAGEGLVLGIMKMVDRVKAAAQGLSDSTVEPFATHATTAGAISPSGVTQAQPGKREGLKIAIENIILQNVGDKDPKELVAEILKLLYAELSGADEVLSAGEMGALLT